MNIYDFSVKNIEGNTVSLKSYAGKVLLIVNTATMCGLTPQYAGLQDLYAAYSQQGFEILDFPCNQFLDQAPGTDEEISQFCTLNYGTDFLRFAKIDVNGQNADPLYIWLKTQISEDQGSDETKEFEQKVQPFTPENKNGDIKWNFGKFLVDRTGKVVARYSPAYPPEKLEEDVKALLR